MLKDELLRHIREQILVGKAMLDPDTPLFSSGLLDSLAVLDLTMFVEQKSGIRFALTEISLENLDSVGHILSFVSSKRAG
jgi:methoxymalonate biosynthesis acyl carrier protein